LGLSNVWQIIKFPSAVRIRSLLFVLLEKLVRFGGCRIA
jgi:hypothetical protein